MRCKGKVEGHDYGRFNIDLIDYSLSEKPRLILFLLMFTEGVSCRSVVLKLFEIAYHLMFF